MLFRRSKNYAWRNRRYQCPHPPISPSFPIAGVLYFQVLVLQALSVFRYRFRVYPLLHLDAYQCCILDRRPFPLLISYGIDPPVAMRSGYESSCYQPLPSPSTDIHAPGVVLLHVKIRSRMGLSSRLMLSNMSSPTSSCDTRRCYDLDT